MNKSIADQLRAAGLVSERDAALADAELALQRGAARPKLPQPTDLESAKTIREQKARLKSKLQRGESVTTEILNAAHRFKEQAGGRAYVHFVYAVRDALQAIGDDQSRRQLFLDRAFRKSNPDLTLPE